MDLTYATIVVLASMIFVLSAMIGYLYWQQTRFQQSLNSLGIAVATLVNPRDRAEEEAEPEPETDQVKKEDVQEVDVPEVDEDDDDDRVSVEHVKTQPAPIDVDELNNKTKAQLQELLKEKGLPYAKSDSKSVLIELLKATA
jgi:hypothetical protein